MQFDICRRLCDREVTRLRRDTRIDERSVVHWWKENRTDDVSSEAHGDAADGAAESAGGTADREYQVGAEEVDVADISDRECKGSEEARRAVP